MIRRLAASLLLALFGCGRERPDPRLAEVTTPIHATVRVIDVAVEKECELGTTLERMKCLVSPASRSGCLYLEVGAAADSPLKARQPDRNRCDAIGFTGARALLLNTPEKKATLYVEPGGARIVVDTVATLHSLYLRGGQVVINQTLWSDSTPRPALLRPDGTMNWSLIPPFLSVLDQTQLRMLTGPELDSLISETPGGRGALKAALLALGAPDALGAEPWMFAISKLEPADQLELRDAMIESVRIGTEGALTWFLEHPEQQGPEFISALGEVVENESGDLSIALPALLELDPKRAERVACEHLERKWHVNTTSVENYGFVPPAREALAVLVARHSKCPWVLPMLERSACSAELRCDPDANDGEETPLCDAEQQAAALERTLHPSTDPDDEEDDTAQSDWGALLLSAALLQGPLPPFLVHANERRQYALTYTYQGSEEDDSCRSLSGGPADWACRLPQAISIATNESCRLVLDDAKKTMTVTPLAVP